MSTLDRILFLIDKAIIEFSHLQGNLIKVKEGYLYLHLLKCVIKSEDHSETNKYFCIIEDKNGSHCVGFSSTREEAENEIIPHWIKMLNLGTLSVTEYSFPDIFPTRKYLLEPKQHAFNITFKEHRERLLEETKNAEWVLNVEKTKKQ